jgi:hypothetical protein
VDVAPAVEAKPTPATSAVGKGTLLGISPDAVAIAAAAQSAAAAGTGTLAMASPPEPIPPPGVNVPAADPVATAGGAPIKATLLGMASPEPLVPAGKGPSADTDASWDLAHRPTSGADAPTPVEVPRSGSDPSINRLAAAPAAEPSRPTGVAKPYVPKDDVNTPAVVVEAAALQAGASAAQAEAAARRGRAARSVNSATIPGTVRVVPHGPHITPDIEPIDSDLAAMKPSRKPLVVVVLLLAIAAVAGAFFVLRPKQPNPVAAAAAPEAAPAAVSAAPTPAPAESAAAEPTPSAEPSASAAPEGSAEKAPAEPTAAESAAPAPPAVAKPQQPVRKPAPVKVQAPAPAKVQAPAKKPAAKKPAGTTSAPATKGKGVIVRESPF